ncbi:MAG: uspA-5 [Dehalococcoidia bacterium]|nr:uspA-5 [Dehalococcoidia bacterium]
MGEQGLVGYKKILVATDGSEWAKAATREAIWLAQRIEAEVVVVYVVDSHGAFHLGIHASEARSEMLAEGRVALRHVSEIASGLEVNIRTELLEGDPKTVIVDYAAQEGVDCLIIGSHGASGIEKALLGSVSTYCVNHAPCPVLVVKPKVVRSAHV